MNNKTLAHEWALDWWTKAKAKGKTDTAICDICNADIAVDDGYLCQSQLVEDNTPDLVCASCFNRNRLKSWENYLPPNSTMKETKMGFFNKLFSSTPSNSQFAYCQNCQKKKGEIYSLGGTFFFCSDQCKNEFSRKLSSGANQNNSALIQNLERIGIDRKEIEEVMKQMQPFHQQHAAGITSTQAYCRKCGQSVQATDHSCQHCQANLR